MLQGHINLREAIERHDRVGSPIRWYRLDDKGLCCSSGRAGAPRREHVLVDGHDVRLAVRLRPYSSTMPGVCSPKAPARIFYCLNWKAIWKRRLWTTVQPRQDELGITPERFKVTVLIKHLAAFEIGREFLYERACHRRLATRGHWDYMFSIIKKFRNRPDFAFPIGRRSR